MSKATMRQATEAVTVLRGFVGRDQLQLLVQLCRGEEGQYFKDKLVEMAGIVKSMPKTYEQDGLGDQALAHLHYFTPSCDWYITERDSDEDGDGQIQAFGSANLGYGAELGYINIVELLAAGAEIDLHFTPITLAMVGKTYEQLKEDIAEVAACPDCNAAATTVPPYCPTHDGDYSSWLVRNNID